ncbi:MAG: hypothetical protein CVU84_05750 [Firmicutes bacterium HGW-Firmicutes-1]|jgi:carbohydrate diacid regulator|nr:MAG: hypothetical protein CVU84_05750 [Firmicutes bacterium HGW-Firmicutes-1]
MLLNKDIAQKLVNNIMDNLGYNINIMNEDGIIIASGSAERLGSYHQIAAEVISKKKRVDIFEGNTSDFVGVKEGINMPFYFHNKIAGVIGITGNPAELENTAMLVKMTAEIMMEQEFLKERTQSHQSQKTFFVNRLLTTLNSDDLLEVSQWALRLGYDLTLRRISCLFSIKCLSSNNNNKSAHNLDIIKKYVLEAIKASPFHSKQDISSSIDVNKIVVLKTIQNTDQKTIRDQVTCYLTPILKTIHDKYSIHVLIGIGSYHEELIHLSDSFSESQAMIEFAEKMRSSDGYYFIYDYILEYFFYKIPKNYHDHFLDNYREELKDRPEIAETINALTKNNMNIADTAKELYVHRNTVLFRINKIKELFDIDPLHQDKDRMLLKLIDFYIKYYM